MHHEVSRKKSLTKGIEITRALFPSQRSILLRKVCKNHADIQIVEIAPSLSHSKRNSQELMSYVREILVNSGKNESTNVRFAHDCTNFFKSRAKFHTIELEDMPSWDPKFSRSTKERFIHFYLMVGKDAREDKRDKSIFENGTKLLYPCQDLQKGEFCHWGTLLSVS